jgi:SAM-dependent methyltransferase
VSPTVVEVLAAVAEGDWSRGADAADRAVADEPDSRLAAALRSFLRSQPEPGVYDEPTAFEAFIDNGANPELYRRTIERLAMVHADRQPLTVLDIGCGDGRVTAGTVGDWTERVDLVEPSAVLLEQATDAVAVAGREVDAHAVDASSFLASASADRSWDLVQSTFALHAIEPGARHEVLRALAARTHLLTIVEFDIPAFDDRSPEHLAYLAERYEAGVREYGDHPEVVAGFLMPVLVGQIDPTRPRYTFEQSVDAWMRDLDGAGFVSAAASVFDYWWGTATLLSAVPQ